MASKRRKLEDWWANIDPAFQWIARQGWRVISVERERPWPFCPWETEYYIVTRDGLDEMEIMRDNIIEDLQDERAVLEAHRVITGAPKVKDNPLNTTDLVVPIAEFLRSDPLPPRPEPFENRTSSS